MFTATGLLSTSSTSLPKPPEDILGSSMFVSNGLLGISPQTVHEVPESESQTTVLNAPSFSFLGTGLLGTDGASSGSSSDTKSTSLSRLQSPDPDFPPISEALGLPPFLPRHSESSSTVMRIPRSTLRATTYDGQTIYLRRKSKVIYTAADASHSSSRSMGNLLGIPIHRLMDRLSTETAANLERRDRELQAQSSIPGKAAVEDMLWVDRYRPRKFIELLGNERVARDALSWVKQWDWCVFGKSRGKKRARDGDEDANLDEFHRPQEKILLLSGPPGLGKTTLAHVVARQAGYEVMEINASDARTGTKPVLLVIDEIDGATGSGDNSNTFIHKLVQLINAKPRKKERSSHHKKSNTGRPILRPIICICNDQNASSLAKLRPHAYQIRFSRPADVHIVKRLKEICEIEGLKADSRALSTLVSVAKGDLRGCLNTLQFIKTRNEDVSEAVIRKATSGMKEADTTVHSVLNNLFTPLTKKRTMELGLTEEEESRYVHRLSRDIEGVGRDSAIATGCFGHYATLRRHDANFSRHEQGIEWLTTHDRLSSAMYTDGDFALIQYLPYTLVPFYPLFQEKSGERVERNQADWEHLQLTRSNGEIFKSLAKCLHTATARYGGNFRHLISTPTLQIEFAPVLNRIISPPLRPVNSQVTRPQEKALMNRLVDIMAALELRFVQERAEDGTLSYRLDPPIDVFVTYDGKRAADIAVSRYAVRQLVSAEIDAKLIARDTEIVEKGKRGKHDFFGKSSSRSDETEIDSTHPSKRVKIDTRDIADKPPTDFFGRPITVPSETTNKAAARKNVEKKYRVTYKFLEGNSAAVRRPVKMSMFL
ncbi:hypothetical protein M413DRAFT_437980 [Hebeloma cylindrosporum]|uniref:AAA+ ATPase domain-containing protein n=1 Tax=Hebeloma cylindrosporum TaxID=76867 RepID=A0A0C3CXC4_HEBCY|nr:hypothetical protein M413DRAFT_437980 [Hebeloma cylindrosporum h7]